MKIIKQTRGFSLIDLMVAMAVIGIGLAITIPAMQEFTDANRQAEIINRLVRDINYAKSEAVSRGTSFTVSTAAFGGGATWDVGWTVFNSTTPPPLPGVRTAPALVVPGQTLISNAGFSSITFRPSGAATGLPVPAAGPPDFTVSLCNACVNAGAPPRERQLTVSPTGRVTLNSQFTCIPASPVCP